HHRRRSRQRVGSRGRSGAHRPHRCLREGVDPRAVVLHDLPADGTRPRHQAHWTLREEIMSNPLTRATPVVRSATGLIPTISGRGGGRGTHLVQYLIVAAVAVFLVALPYLGVTKFQIGQTTTILIAAMAAASVSFLVGEAGLASLGHGAIAGTASYGMAWAFHQGWDTGLSIILAIALTLAVSLIYGLLTMRTSGIYFLMVTLAIGMLIYGLAFRMSSVTGGDNGLLLQRPEWINARENWWIFYYLVLALLIVTTLVLGAWNTQSVSPESVNVETSILLIVMVILGGVGTLLGPLVGATIVILVKFTVSSYVDRWQTLLGIVFIVVILLAREGVVGSIGKLTNRIRKRRAQRAAGEDVPEAGASASNVSHT